MLFTNIDLNGKESLYIQIKKELVKMIEEGMLAEGSKLPSTRELSEILGVSRNSCMHAYEILEDDGYIHILKGRGAFVSHKYRKKASGWKMDWKQRSNHYGKMAVDLDIVKSEPATQKGMISFKSIAPDEKLFNLDHIRRGFINSIFSEGEKLFNYGYARGYKPFIEFLKGYMESKGVDLKNKEILVTNGFTEGFDIILSVLTDSGESAICENPTHNTAIKLMKLHGLEIIGADIEQGVINTLQLEKKLSCNNTKLIYLTPSYHNPTGTVMSAEKRKEVYELCKKYKVPIVEDGFNEELLYSSSHISPIAALDGEDNGVVYIGSFSKILFPGIRLGWVAADNSLIDILESVKRSKNIHSSVIDQAFLNEYLRNGDFQVYLKKAKRSYRNKYKFTIECIEKYIPHCKIYGEGGLHIFLEFDNIDTRKLLDATMKEGVIFMPGDIFYIDGERKDTMRLGFSRLDYNNIKKGIEIIGGCIEKLI